MLRVFTVLWSFVVNTLCSLLSILFNVKFYCGFLEWGSGALWRWLSYKRFCVRVCRSDRLRHHPEGEHSFRTHKLHGQQFAAGRMLLSPASYLPMNTYTQHARYNTTFHLPCHGVDGDRRLGDFYSSFQSGVEESYSGDLVRQSLSQGGEHRWVQRFSGTVVYCSFRQGDRQ